MNIILGFQKWVYALCLSTPWHVLDQYHIFWFTTSKCACIFIFKQFYFKPNGNFRLETIKCWINSC